MIYRNSAYIVISIIVLIVDLIFFFYQTDKPNPTQYTTHINRWNTYVKNRIKLANRIDINTSATFYESCKLKYLNS